MTKLNKFSNSAITTKNIHQCSLFSTLQGYISSYIYNGDILSKGYTNHSNNLLDDNTFIKPRARAKTLSPLIDFHFNPQFIHILFISWLTVITFGGQMGVNAVSRNYMLPYESRSCVTLPSIDEISSNEIELNPPIHLYDREFTNLYVNSNGFISFDTEIPSYVNKRIPLGYPIVAVWYSDIALSKAGRLYYCLQTNETRKQYFEDVINTKFYSVKSKNVTKSTSKKHPFQVTRIFAATWEDVKGFLQVAPQGNTFQLILASGTNETTFAIFIYPENGLHWYTTKSKVPNSPHLIAQAGFDAGDSFRHYELPNTEGHSILTLTERSNVGIPGVWIYKIGFVRYIEEPKIAHKNSTLLMGDDDGPDQCNEQSCPINSHCINVQPTGICCQCKPEYFGNGIHCVAEKTPLRINGLLRGLVNGQPLKNIELHSYVVSVDGRMYTALSGIPHNLSQNMKLLLPIADSINWLFATRGSTNVSNGFSLTGGVFNRTTTINFDGTNEQMDLKEYFHGPDVYGNLKMDLEVVGDLPRFESHNQIDFLDYVEEFVRVDAGRINSQSKLIFRITGLTGVEERAYFVSQEIAFDAECPELYEAAAKTNSTTSSLLSVARNFAVYDQREQVLRFASQSKIRNFGDDPCKDIMCPAYSTCVNKDNSYSCECKSGFIINGELCQDINECRNTSICDELSECFNTPGSYKCRCKYGILADGINCASQPITIPTLAPENDCQQDESLCDEKAFCDVSTSIPRCRCKIGFTGNGIRCYPLDDHTTLESTELPSTVAYVIQPNNYTITNAPELPHHDCRVRPELCHKNSECVWSDKQHLFVCRCRPGFVGNGEECDPVNPKLDCSFGDFCHAKAMCTYDSTRNQFDCICNPGYVGDGVLSCSKDTTSCRYRPQVCGPPEAGSCIYDLNTSHHVCQCMPHHEFNGKTCVPKKETNEVGMGPYLGRGFAANGLIYAQGSSIMHLTLDNSQSMPFGQNPVDKTSKHKRLDKQPTMKTSYLINDRTQIAVGVASDCKTGHIYWTDVVGKQIKKAWRDGSHISTFINTDLITPELLSLDWLNRNLFWTDSAKQTIEMASLDTGKRRIVVSENLINPRGIALNWREGRLYWTDWNRDYPKIETCLMDGSERHVLVDRNLKLPNSLIYDDLTDQLCWVDAGIKTLECLNTKTNQRNVLVSNLTYPFGLVQTERSLYWTDWKKSQIYSASTQNGFSKSPLTLTTSGKGRLYGISDLTTICPPDTNGCRVNMGGCKHICISTPNSTTHTKCLCPDGIRQEYC